MNVRHNNRNSQQARKGKGKVKHNKQEGGRVVKEKFAEDRQRRIVPLQPKSDNQRKTLNAFRTKQMIIQGGSAGSGKSELACWWASKLWLQGDIDNIVITRPHKHLGSDYGATKGNDAEKLLPFCMSMLMKLKRYLGVGTLSSNFKLDGFDSLFQEAAGIQIVPVEKMQGLSFSDRTIIIADECQNMTIAQIKALATRMEEGCQILICGDPLQTALGDDNGLNYLCDKITQYPHNLISITTYEPSDCCRKGVAAHLTRIFEEDGNW